MDKKKVLKRGLAAGLVVAALAAVFAFTPTGAQAAKLITSGMIKDQTIQSRDIAAGGVAASEVRNNSLTGTDMTKGTRDKIVHGEKAYQEIQDEKAQWALDTFGMTETEKNDYATKEFVNDKFGEAVSSQTETPVTLAQMGGKFNDNKVVLAELTLKPGEYSLSTDGIFTTLNGDAAGFFAQVAVRVEDGSNGGWGKDFGTCFTADFGTQKDRETSCSTTRLVQVDEETEVVVYGFGYQRNGQGGATNAVEGSAFVSATPVN